MFVMAWNVWKTIAPGAAREPVAAATGARA